MTRYFSVSACLVSLFLFWNISQVFADYFKYTDSRGVVCITNKLDSVPQKYRATMKVIKEGSSPGNAGGSSYHEGRDDAGGVKETAAPAPAPAPPGKFAELSARFVWFKPVVYIFAFLASLTVIGKICQILPSRQLGRTIYLAFFFGVFVLLYNSYSKRAVETYHKLRDDANAVVKKSQSHQQSLPAEAGDPVKAQDSGALTDRAK